MNGSVRPRTQIVISCYKFVGFFYFPEKALTFWFLNIFFMFFFVESDLILKRPFPGSFVVARVSGGDLNISRKLRFFLQKCRYFSWNFENFTIFITTFLVFRFSWRSSNFFVFKYFLMTFFLKSDLILKRPFPGSFVVAWVSGGVQNISRKMYFFFKNVSMFLEILKISRFWLQICRFLIFLKKLKLFRF